MKIAAKAYYENLASSLHSVRATLADGKEIPFFDGIAEACRMILELRRKCCKMMFIGNGASAAIASHMAADFSKNLCARAIAFNDAPLLTAISNDHGYDEVFERPVRTFADPHDIMVAISSSGASQNILRAARAAIDSRCLLITLTGFQPDNPLGTMGCLNFYVPSPAYGCVEVVHHSICHCILDMLVHADREREGSAPD